MTPISIKVVISKSKVKVLHLQDNMINIWKGENTKITLKRISIKLLKIKREISQEMNFINLVNMILIVSNKRMEDYLVLKQIK